MPTLENKWYRRMIFVTVYLVETIITYTTLSIFPLLFNNLNIDPALYGVFGSISLLPMVFKFFIGPISDRFPIPFLRGRRRGYIILGALLNIIFIPFLSLNPKIFFLLFFIIWFFQTLGIAIVDILTDAIAVGSVKSIQNTRGRTEASSWIFLGIFLGGLFILPLTGMLEDHTLDPGAGIDITLLTMLGLVSILAIIPLILFIFLKENNSHLPKKQNILEDIKRNIKYPFVKMGLLFGFLLLLDTGLLELTLEPYLQDKLGIVSIQEIVGSLFLVSLLGTITAFLGYYFIDRLKKNRVLIIISIIYTIPSFILAFFIFTEILTFNLFLILYGVNAFVSGLSYVTFMGLFFELSDPKASGTMIALFLSITNLGACVGVAIGGFLSMGIIYVIVGIICILRIIPLSRINMDNIKKTFYEEEEKIQSSQ